MAVLVVPDVGWSRAVWVGLVGFVWCVALTYRACVRALVGRPREVVELLG
ncbi:hypothetical protein [Actinomyces qiguomingii]|nr:hypothetical protein [Actinomyces qiguomingii]